MDGEDDNFTAPRMFPRPYSLPEKSFFSMYKDSVEFNHVAVSLCFTFHVHLFL